MAEPRDRPYSQFNFYVEIDNGPDKESVPAGFQEVSGLGLEVTIAEYRAGNEVENAPIKITGTHKVPDVTLKRGVIGELQTIHQWMEDVRKGRQDMLRTVTIELLAEDRSGPVQTWTLRGARPMKYTAPTFSGTGAEVAMEELVLAAEGIDIVETGA